MSSSAGSAAVRHRAAVLKAYRDFVDVARRSRPVAERQAKLDEVRTAIRANAGETDESKRLDLLKELVGRVGFLRIVTPKTGRGRHTREAGSFVMRDGEVVEGVGQTGGQRVADGKISRRRRTTITTGYSGDSISARRHHRSLPCCEHARMDARASRREVE